MDARPEFLIIDVIAAQRVAVHEQGLYPMKTSDVRIRDEPCTAAAGKYPSHQQIPVSVHEIKPGAAACKTVQRLRHPRIERVFQIIVTDPGFEQVAEYIKRIGMRCGI